MIVSFEKAAFENYCLHRPLFLDEKSRLRKQIPTFILKLSLIAGRTSSLQYLQQMMKLLIQLTGDQVT